MSIRITAVCLLILVELFSHSLRAQSDTGYGGNSLSGFLGKKVDDSGVKGLLSNFNCEMVNAEHYLSKSGIEFIFLKNVLSGINIYNNSSVYGNFKETLPEKLRFGLSSGEVKKMLGKPSLSYNSGYCEFELRDCLLSCWFDNGVLSQIGLTVKTGM